MEKRIEPRIAEALNQFAELLNLCREELSKLTLVEDRTYEYAIGRAYSKVLLSCCEIYLLLNNGFPEGALALSRSVYEALVVISILLKGKKENNTDLIDKFFDAAEISALKIDQDRAEWVSKTDPNCQLATEIEKEITNKLQEYTNKHKRKDFRDYWWADAATFADLAKRSGFSKSPMYKRLSGNVHFLSELFLCQFV